MVEAVAFKKEHLEYLLNLPMNSDLKSWLININYHIIEQPKNSVTILDSKTKEVLGCGGVVPYWAGRAEAWVVFGQNAKHKMVQLRRCVIRFFDMCEHSRIESVIDLNSPVAHRWIKSLGFTVEAPLMKNYWGLNKDAVLYARIR